MTPLPESLVRRVPPPRRPWLEHLPAWIDLCVREWDLRLAPPYPGLWLNYVAPVLLPGGEAAVLKMGDPSDAEFASEVGALRAYNGQGAVRLLAVDVAHGALLLERLGAPLSDVADDDAATRASAEVMRALWRPAPVGVPHPFPTVADWGRGLVRLRAHFGGGTGPFPPELVDAAEHLFAELGVASAPPVILHGDLHDGNILSSSRAPWLAIDPKGVIGEPAYEAGAVVRDDLPKGADPAQRRSIVFRRIAILSEVLGIDRERIRGWALAQAVLSAWWCIEDGGSGDDPGLLAVAEALR